MGLEEGLCWGHLGNWQLDFFLTFLLHVVNSREVPPAHFVLKKAARYVENTLCFCANEPDP